MSNLAKVLRYSLKRKTSKRNQKSTKPMGWDGMGWGAWMGCGEKLYVLHGYAISLGKFQYVFGPLEWIVRYSICGVPLVVK